MVRRPADLLNNDAGTNGREEWRPSTCSIFSVDLRLKRSLLLQYSSRQREVGERGGRGEDL
jgi:hypothetical protein